HQGEDAGSGAAPDGEPVETAPGSDGPVEASPAEAPAADAASTADTEAASAAAAGVPLEILDIPLVPKGRPSRKVSAPEAEQLLDSVLEALPEPKSPGTGRRSRRASTAGNVVTPPEAR